MLTELWRGKHMVVYIPNPYHRALLTDGTNVEIGGRSSRLELTHQFHSSMFYPEPSRR